MKKLIIPLHKQNYFCLKVIVASNFNETNITVEKSSIDTLPSLKHDNLCITESNSISYILGKEVLWGKNAKENALIYQWIEYADTKLNPLVCKLVLSSELNRQSKKDTNQAGLELKKCLLFLDSYLLENMYLVGNRITQADIACAAALLPGFKPVIKENLQEFVNVTRWFMTLINQPQFQKELNNEATPSKDSQKDDNSKELAKPKSAAQLKKEAKKKEKMEKFLAKQKKMGGESTTKKEPKVVAKVCTVSSYDHDTPPGEKKNIDNPLPDSYSPKYVEAAWYSWWEKMGFFKPEYGGKDLSKADNDVFMVCLPPPNVTGSLHLGHALTNTIQDVLSRWHRMNGKVTLWAPGVDHAGIATQVVVEKKLWKEKQLSRHDLGRDAFLEEVWKWKREKGDRICHQLRKLGSSLDWSREFFTMNDDLSHAVKYSFVTLHDRGTIFRSNRLVNWSCTLRSAISDIEVNKLELTGRTLLSVPGYDQKVEFGVLISFAYPIVDSDEELVVATTRIETMLGDTAVAVHPNDQRYKHLHGKFVKHPFSDKHLPIVCDEMVDISFGTGAVKITPAHDANDYDCGKRHNLKFITIFTDDGFVNNTNTEFDGMKRFVARRAVLKALKDKGLYREIKDNPMVVPICSRSKDIVEPLIKVQWFMNCKEAAKKSVEAVKNGELKLIPDMHCKTWFYWLENIRDWCISRQLWWGHRIPAYFVTIKDGPKGEVSDGEFWVSGMTEDEAKEKAAAKFKVDASRVTLRQDDDVLDTWYSSGLLPFSIFGWPNKTTDLSAFFPGTLLETGHDIIFFWVARMVMFSIMLTDKLPFEEVYFHAMVRDAHGRKMSKSLGNVIDPLDVVNGISLEDLHKTLLSGNLDAKEIETAKLGQKQDYPTGIPECGTDALRFALCAYTLQGRDINLDVKRILGYRHFCNKIWNAFKFGTKGLGETYEPPQSFEFNKLENPLDKWILSRLSTAIQLSDSGLRTYNFPAYTTAIFNFWLYDLCDVYLEHLKSVFLKSDPKAVGQAKDTLYTCLEVALRLTHPLMPFISEELWQRLPKKLNEAPLSISVGKWPTKEEHDWRDEDMEKNLEFAMNIVKSVRSLRAQYKLTKTKAALYIRISNEHSLACLTNFIQTLSCSSEITFLSETDSSPPGCAVAIVNSKCEVHLLLQGLIDVSKEMSKLQSKRQEISRKLESLRNKRQMKEYKTKVPLNVQAQDESKLKEMETELQKMVEAEKNILKLSNNA